MFKEYLIVNLNSREVLAWATCRHRAVEFLEESFENGADVQLFEVYDWEDGEQLDLIKTLAH